MRVAVSTAQKRKLRSRDTRWLAKGTEAKTSFTPRRQMPRPSKSGVKNYRLEEKKNKTGQPDFANPVVSAAITEMPQTAWLKHQKFYISPFWRPEVQNQGASMDGFWWETSCWFADGYFLIVSSDGGEKAQLWSSFWKDTNLIIKINHFMANRWEKMETVTDFIFLGSKITAHSDYSHKIKRY